MSKFKKISKIFLLEIFLYFIKAVHEFRFTRAAAVLTDRRAVAFKQRRVRPQNPQVLAPLSDDSTMDSEEEDEGDESENENLEGGN